jgi:hypothetical protein
LEKNALNEKEKESSTSNFKVEEDECFFPASSFELNQTQL